VYRTYEVGVNPYLFSTGLPATLSPEELFGRFTSLTSALDADNQLQKRRLDNLALASRCALAAMRATIDARRSGSLDSALRAR
jgi:CHASE3 domain sensor protein